MGAPTWPPYPQTFGAPRRSRGAPLLTEHGSAILSAIMRAALVLHGPNLNLLGTREPGVYGRVSLAEVDRLVRERGRRRGLRVECRQSNVEGELINWLQGAAREGFGGVVF